MLMPLASLLAQGKSDYTTLQNILTAQISQPAVIVPLLGMINIVQLTCASSCYFKKKKVLTLSYEVIIRLYPA